MLNPEELDAVDDFRFKERMPQQGSGSTRAESWWRRIRICASRLADFRHSRRTLPSGFHLWVLAILCVRISRRRCASPNTIMWLRLCLLQILAADENLSDFRRTCVGNRKILLQM